MAVLISSGCRLDWPADSGRLVGRRSLSDISSSSSSSMTSEASKVIVSDRGPPLLFLGLVRHSPPSERWPRRWPVLLFLLAILSAQLPNSCYAASIQTAGRSRSMIRHHPYHPTTTTTTTTTTTPRPTTSRLVAECPWLEWEPNRGDQPLDNNLEGPADVAGTRAYMAPVVFEGKARSRSDGPVYRVTFDVVTVYKGEVATGSQVRLEFKSGQSSSSSSKSLRSLSHTNNSAARSPHRTLSASSSSNSNSRSSSSSSGTQLHHHRQHHHRHQHHSNRECLVTADIRTGRRYLVFAAHWGPNNFTAFGSPLVHTKKSLKDVRSTLCPRCGESHLLLLLLLLPCCPSLFWLLPSPSSFSSRRTLKMTATRVWHYIYLCVVG